MKKIDNYKEKSIPKVETELCGKKLGNLKALIKRGLMESQISEESIDAEFANSKNIYELLDIQNSIQKSTTHILSYFLESDEYRQYHDIIRRKCVDLEKSLFPRLLKNVFEGAIMSSDEVPMHLDVYIRIICDYWREVEMIDSKPVWINGKKEILNLRESMENNIHNLKKIMNKEELKVFPEVPEEIKKETKKVQIPSYGEAMPQSWHKRNK